MKKIIFFAGIIIILFSGYAFAGLHIDVGGAFNGAGDADYQYGGSWALAYGLNKNINIIYRGSYTIKPLEDEGNLVRQSGFSGTGYYSSGTDSPDAREYNQMYHLFGVEYLYHFSKLPLAIKGSILVGMSSLEMYDPTLDTNSGDLAIGNGSSSTPWQTSNKWSEGESDTGLGIGIWIGIVYNATQFIAPFLDFGYVYSYYGGELSDKSVHGISAMLGLRFSIYWKNRGLLDEY